MTKEEAHFLFDKIHRVKHIVKLGTKSEHNMEREIFKHVNDELSELNGWVDSFSKEQQAKGS